MSIGETLGGVWADFGIRTLNDDELLGRSSGAVLKPETLNYRTLKPEPGGLFDSNVFADPEAAEQLRLAGMDVEWTPTPATARFGHIELAQPIVHPYYATHGLDELARACGWMSSQARAVLEQEVVVYDGQMLTMEEVSDPEQTRFGAAAIADVLEDPSAFLVQRLLIAPVGARPMVKTNDGWVTSHINDLYRRVINRNNRLRRLLELNAPHIIIMNEQRMLQQSASQLCFNGFPGLKLVTGPGREPLVSLFELAGRDAADLPVSLDGTGPACGVRALRAFESIGFQIGEAALARDTPSQGTKKGNFSLAGVPLPIPEPTD